MQNKFQKKQPNNITNKYHSLTQKKNARFRIFAPRLASDIIIALFSLIRLLWQLHCHTIHLENSVFQTNKTSQGRSGTFKVQGLRFFFAPFCFDFFFSFFQFFFFLIFFVFSCFSFFFNLRFFSFLFFFCLRFFSFFFVRFLLFGQVKDNARYDRSRHPPTKVSSLQS